MPTLLKKLDRVISLPKRKDWIPIIVFSFVFSFLAFLVFENASSLHNLIYIPSVIISGFPGLVWGCVVGFFLELKNNYVSVSQLRRVPSFSLFKFIFVLLFFSFISSGFFVRVHYPEDYTLLESMLIGFGEGTAFFVLTILFPFLLGYVIGMMLFESFVFFKKHSVFHT